LSLLCASSHTQIAGNLRTPNRLRLLSLIAILAVAAVFRFYGLFWGTGFDAHPHPDEQYLAERILRVSLKRPIQWSELLDPQTSPLNPRRLNPETGRYYRLEYGTFLVYVTRGTAAALGVAGFYALNTFEGFILIGRVICAILSVLTVLLTYLLGAEIYGHRAGLWGAAALAVTVTHIQISHFAIVDAPLTMFAVAVLWFAVRFAHHGRKTDAFLMGLALAGAMATKLTGVPLALAVAAAYLVRAMVSQPASEKTSPYVRLLNVVARHLGWTFLGFLLLFGTFEFYLLLNPSSYSFALGGPLTMLNGDNDVYFTRQFVNTIPYLYQIENLVRWGMGWPLGVFGLIAALSESLRPFVQRLRTRLWLNSADLQGIAIVVAWSLPFFIYVGALETKFARYMLPLVPIICMFAGGFLAEVIGYLRGRLRLLGWALPLLILLPTLGWAVAFVSIYARPHTWLAASRWLYTHIPPGAIVASPIWDQPLPVSVPSEDRYWDKHLKARVILDVFADVTPEAKFQQLTQAIGEADVIALPTQRGYGTVRRLPWRYPVEIRFFQLLFEEKLGYELAYVSVSYPSLFGAAFVDDAAGEDFSVYDHPKVLIYRKTRNLPTEELRNLFAESLAAMPVVSRTGRMPAVELAVPGYNSERVRALIQNSEE
jgi:hypothetical protein